MQLAAIDCNEDIMRDEAQKMIASDLLHHVLTFRRSSESTDLGGPHGYGGLKACLGFLDVLSPNMRLVFPKRQFVGSLYCL